MGNREMGLHGEDADEDHGGPDVEAGHHRHPGPREAPVPGPGFCLSVVCCYFNCTIIGTSARTGRPRLVTARRLGFKRYASSK